VGLGVKWPAFRTQPAFGCSAGWGRVAGGPACPWAGRIWFNPRLFESWERGKVIQRLGCPSPGCGFQSQGNAGICPKPGKPGGNPFKGASWRYCFPGFPNGFREIGDTIHRGVVCTEGANRSAGSGFKEFPCGSVGALRPGGGRCGLSFGKTRGRGGGRGAIQGAVHSLVLGKIGRWVEEEGTPFRKPGPTTAEISEKGIGCGGGMGSEIFFRGMRGGTKDFGRSGGPAFSQSVASGVPFAATILGQSEVITGAFLIPCRGQHRLGLRENTSAKKGEVLGRFARIRERASAGRPFLSIL